jgi:hypothetical protein
MDDILTVAKVLECSLYRPQSLKWALKLPLSAALKQCPDMNHRPNETNSMRSADRRDPDDSYSAAAALPPRSFPTLSSTPLINCTDSGLENLRAISSASLITTARGVPG